MNVMRARQKDVYMHDKEADRNLLDEAAVTYRDNPCPGTSEKLIMMLQPLIRSSVYRERGISHEDAVQECSLAVLDAASGWDGQRVFSKVAKTAVKDAIRRLRYADTDSSLSVRQVTRYWSAVRDYGSAEDAYRAALDGSMTGAGRMSASTLLAISVLINRSSYAVDLVTTPDFDAGVIDGLYARYLLMVLDDWDRERLLDPMTRRMVYRSADVVRLRCGFSDDAGLNERVEAAGLRIGEPMWFEGVGAVLGGGRAGAFKSWAASLEFLREFVAREAEA